MMSKRIHVMITTYNRPDQCMSLLEDIEAERGDYEVSLTLLDDCSDENYVAVQHYCEAREWMYKRARINHGKRGFSQTMRTMIGLAADINADYYIYLQDDGRLCDGFFDKAISAWEAIDDPGKVSLTLARDSLRDGNPQWTGCEPVAVSFAEHLMQRTGWVEAWWPLCPSRATPLGYSPSRSCCPLTRRGYEWTPRRNASRSVRCQYIALARWSGASHRA